MGYEALAEASDSSGVRPHTLLMAPEGSNMVLQDFLEGLVPRVGQRLKFLLS